MPYLLFLSSENFFDSPKYRYFASAKLHLISPILLTNSPKERGSDKSWSYNWNPTDNRYFLI